MLKARTTLDLQIGSLLLPIDEEPHSLNDSHGPHCPDIHLHIDCQYCSGKGGFLSAPPVIQTTPSPCIDSVQTTTRSRSIAKLRSVSTKKTKKITRGNGNPLAQVTKDAKTANQQIPHSLHSTNSQPQEISENRTLPRPKPSNYTKSPPVLDVATLREEAREFRRVNEKQRRERFSIAIDKINEVLPAEYKTFSTGERKLGEGDEDIREGEDTVGGGAKRIQRSFAKGEAVEMAVVYIKYLKAELDIANKRVAIASKKLKEARLNQP